MKEQHKDIEKDVAHLAQIRDELRLQVHLGAAEAKDMWNRLEEQWPLVEKRLDMLRRESTEAKENVADATRALIEQIKEGYQILRHRHT